MGNGGSLILLHKRRKSPERNRCAESTRFIDVLDPHDERPKINAIELAEDLAEVITDLVKERDRAQMQVEALIAELGRVAQALHVACNMKEVLGEIEMLQYDRAVFVKLSRGEQLNAFEFKRMDLLANFIVDSLPVSALP